ncbi:MAG: S9 family peptidase [Bacillota bacterium]
MNEAIAGGSCGVSSRDLFLVQHASDPQISPDGKSLAWVRTSLDADSNSYLSSIYLTDLATGRSRRITTGPRDTHPRWSPDGSMLAFVGRRSMEAGGERSNSRQVYLMRSEGGEAWPLTDLRDGAGVPLWSPDGSRIAFIARLDERRGLQRIGDPDPTRESLHARYTDDVLVIRRRKWKSNEAGFIAHKRSHVVLVEVVDDPDADRPVPHLAVGGDLDVSGFCWDPTGEMMAFITQPDPEPGKAYERKGELRIAGVEDCPTSSRLVAALRRLESTPAWSPDGSTIAVLGHDSPRASYADTRMFVIDPGGSEVRCISEDAGRSLGDRSVGDTRAYGSAGALCWCDDGEALMAQVSDMGTVQVLKVVADGSRLQRLTDGYHQVNAFDYHEGSDQLALLISDMLNPGDLYLTTASGGELRRLTHLNDWLGDRALIGPERIVVAADDGTDIEGWVMRPAGFEQGRKYPTVLQIHGGPVRQYGYTYMNEFQVLAGRGYAVIFCNPRGSQGYGEDFCAAIQEDRGNRDYRDIMQFADGAVAQFDFLDADRMGVAGGSYGGFMVNWIIGHTDRFAAAVSMRSITNNYTEYGTGDRGYQREAASGGGAPWENPDGYMDSSPIKYIGSCTTPTMVIHSDMDLRCPVDQGELLYSALHRLGVPTEFVRFPGETHELSRSGKPWHRVFRLNKIVEWFERWLKGADGE